MSGPKDDTKHLTPEQREALRRLSANGYTVDYKQLMERIDYQQREIDKGYRMGSTIDKNAGGKLASPLTDEQMAHVRELLGYKAFRTFHMLDASRRLKGGEDPSTVEGYEATDSGFRCWDQAVSQERWQALSEEEREVWRKTAGALLASTNASRGHYLPWTLRGKPTLRLDNGAFRPLEAHRLRVTTNGRYVYLDEHQSHVEETFERDHVEWAFPAFDDPATGTPDRG